MTKKTYDYGLVVGKFDPFHKGHQYLIQQALNFCAFVEIGIVDSHFDIVDAQVRMHWIYDTFKDLQMNVFILPDIYDDDNSKAWAEHTLDVLSDIGNGGFTDETNCVFSSEDYGPEYAKYLGFNHHMVDRERTAVPISATAIRQNPIANWQYIPAAVRPWFLTKIVVMGPESSGTTFLAEALAAEFDAPCVPEFGRTYCEMIPDLNNYQWTHDDFVTIARVQKEYENAAAQVSNGIIICDTDPLTTSVFEHYYTNNPEPFINPDEDVDYLRDYKPADLYILTAGDFPFHQDGTRREVIDRRNMYVSFGLVCDKQNSTILEVHGEHQVRLHEACVVIDEKVLQPVISGKKYERVVGV